MKLCIPTAYVAFIFVFCVAAWSGSFVSAQSAAVEQQLFSGPQPGEKVQPFKVISFRDEEPKLV